jgi:DNA-binding NtrC family response regulator
VSVFKQSSRGCSKTGCVQATDPTATAGKSAQNVRKRALLAIGTRLARLLAMRLSSRPDEHTTIAIQRTDTSDAQASINVPPSGVDLVAVERALIQFALEVHGGNRTRAARFLGLSRSALLYRLQKHHLVPPHARGPIHRELS